MNASMPTSLTDGLDAIIEMDAPLAGHTWFGVGGNADMLVRPKTEAALKELLRRCHNENKSVRVLGSGSNSPSRVSMPSLRAIPMSLPQSRKLLPVVIVNLSPRLQNAP